MHLTQKIQNNHEDKNMSYNFREKLRLVHMSMFEFDWEHPNFMPVTRDLSGDKTEWIRKWIECEASENPEAKSDTTPNRR